MVAEQLERVHLVRVAAEVLAQAARLGDRVEGGVGDGPADLAAQHVVLPTVDRGPLHRARPERRVEVAGEGVERLVVVVVRVPHRVPELVHARPGVEVSRRHGPGRKGPWPPPHDLLERLLSPAEVRITIPASPEDVFAVLSDPETYPDWLAGRAAHPPRRRGVPRAGRHVRPRGRADRGRHRRRRQHAVAVDDPPHRLQLEVHVGPVTGLVDFELERTGEGTEVRFRESARPAGSGSPCRCSAARSTCATRRRSSGSSSASSRWSSRLLSAQSP